MDNKNGSLKIEELKFFKNNCHDIFYEFCKTNKLITLDDLLLHLYNNGIKVAKKPSFYELNGIINLIKYEYFNLLCIDLKRLGFSKTEMRYFFNIIDNDMIGNYTIGELIMFAEIKILLCLNVSSADVLKNKVCILAKYYREHVYKKDNEFLIKNLYALKISLYKYTDKIEQINCLVKSLKGE